MLAECAVAASAVLRLLLRPLLRRWTGRGGAGSRSVIRVSTIAAAIHVRRCCGWPFHGSSVRWAIEIASAGIVGTGAGTGCCAGSAVIWPVVKGWVGVVGTVRRSKIIVGSIGRARIPGIVRPVCNLRIHICHRRPGPLIWRVGVSALIGGLAFPVGLTGTIVATGKLIVRAISWPIVPVVAGAIVDGVVVELVVVVVVHIYVHVTVVLVPLVVVRRMISVRGTIAGIHRDGREADSRGGLRNTRRRNPTMGRDNNCCCC